MKAKRWDYRVVRRKRGVEESFAIHEVEYSDDGVADSISEEEIAPWGLSREDLEINMRWMAEALSLPTLDYDALLRGEKCGPVLKPVVDIPPEDEV